MKKNYGIIAAFDTTPELYQACEKVRDAGYSQWDALTPFPIHGLDAAMGMRRSKVPRFSLAGGSRFPIPIARLPLLLMTVPFQ